MFSGTNITLSLLVENWQNMYYTFPWCLGCMCFLRLRWPSFHTQWCDSARNTEWLNLVYLPSCWTFLHGPRGMEQAGDCAWGPKVICHPEYSVLNLKINLQSCQLFLEKGNQNMWALQVFLHISQILARRNSFLSTTVPHHPAGI